MVLFYRSISRVDITLGIFSNPLRPATGIDQGCKILHVNSWKSYKLQVFFWGWNSFTKKASIFCRFSRIFVVFFLRISGELADAPPPETHHTKISSWIHQGCTLSCPMSQDAIVADEGLRFGSPTKSIVILVVFLLLGGGQPKVY